MDSDNSKSPEEVVAEYKKNQKQKRKKIIIGVIVGWLIVSQLGNLLGEDTNSTNTESSTNNSMIDVAWIPEGFNPYPDDSNLAWRWGSSSETECSYSSGACWTIIAIAKDGCKRSLYGEVNIFDNNDIQISYTNDTLGAVAPMQKVKLTFDTFEDTAASANISRFSCY